MNQGFGLFQNIGTKPDVFIQMGGREVTVLSALIMNRFPRRRIDMIVGRIDPI